MSTRQNSKPIHSVDFLLQDCGSVLFLRPQNSSAEEWINQYVSREGFQPQWPTVLLERRYAADLLVGLQNDGFVVETA